MVIAAPSLLKNTKISAITLFPFILLQNPADRANIILLTHEKIHLRQQAELLVIFFYIWYVTEYGIRLLKTRNRYLAYKSISFEREAYANEHNLSYRTDRSFWAFLQYV